MKNQTVFDAMVAEAASKDLPKHYTDDLFVHDRGLVTSDDCPGVFGWILRKCGTQYIVPNSEWCKVQIDYHADAQRDGKAHYYLVDTTRSGKFDCICECSADEMKAWYNTESQSEKAKEVIAKAKDFALEFNCRTYVLRNHYGQFSFTAATWLPKMQREGWSIYQEI